MVLRAVTGQLCAIFAYTEHVVGIGVGDSESATRLDGGYYSQIPTTKDRTLEPARPAGECPDSAEHEPVGAIEAGPSPSLASRVLVPQSQRIS